MDKKKMRVPCDGFNCIWEYKGRPCTMVGLEMEIDHNKRKGEVLAFYVIVDRIEIRADYDDLKYEVRVH